MKIYCAGLPANLAKDLKQAKWKRLLKSPLVSFWEIQENLFNTRISFALLIGQKDIENVLGNKTRRK